MFKRLTAILTFIVFILSVPMTAFASGTIEGYPNFRSSPSTSSTVFENLNNNQRVDVLDQINRYWVKIRANGRTGYVSTSYINSIASSSKTGTITYGVNFRSSPSSSSKVYRMLSKGSQVTVLDEVNSYWVKISTGGQTGYISTKYVNYSGSSSSSSTSSSRISSTQRANNIIAYGKRFMGTPYKFGAEYENDRMFDCSSFMQYIFKKNGITLPRVSRQQAKLGRTVSKSNLQKGDLVFFTVGSSSRIGHVGVYIGNGAMLHTFGSGGVKISSVHSGYWSSHYVTAKRIIK